MEEADKSKLNLEGIEKQLESNLGVSPVALFRTSNWNKSRKNTENQKA